MLPGTHVFQHTWEGLVDLVMQFEAYWCIFSHLPMRIVKWWSYDHAHCMKEWVEICNHTSPDRPGVSDFLMYVENHGKTWLSVVCYEVCYALVALLLPYQPTPAPPFPTIYMYNSLTSLVSNLPELTRGYSPLDWIDHQEQQANCDNIIIVVYLHCQSP